MDVAGFVAEVAFDRKSSSLEGTIHYYPAQEALLEPSRPVPPPMAEVPKPASKRRRRRKARTSGDGGGEAKKRKLTDEQVRFLEMSFGEERKLESGRKAHLASEVGLDPKQVAVWFQNRRARWKSKKLEEGFSRLKLDYDAAVREKCQREAEVVQLKQQLVEAQKEIERLAQVARLSCSSVGGDQSSSPSTSFSVDTQQQQQQPEQPFLCDFGGGGGDGGEFFCIGDDNYVSVIDWMSLYNYSM